MGSLDFPLWLRLSHFLNFLFLSLLVRSGIHILTAKPKLYLNENCAPGTEWLDLSRFSIAGGNSGRSARAAALVALPGGHPESGLGAARGIHFLSVFFWCANGITYVCFLFASGQWKRLIPMSPDFFHSLWNELSALATFHLPAHTGEYGAIQQVLYALVVFLMAPLSILTGAAMSNVIDEKHSWYPRLFGGRQAARSIHYLLLVLYLAFLVIHVSMVISAGLAEQMNRIALNITGDSTGGVVVAAVAITLVVALHVAVGRWSHSDRDGVERIASSLPDRLCTMAFGRVGAAKVEAPEYIGIQSDDELREVIRILLVEKELKTQMEPFPETRKEFDAIVAELHDLDKNDLEQKLVISGFAGRPINDQECSQCMYYLVNRKWCDIPELSLPVEPEWWCRLWRM